MTSTLGIKKIQYPNGTNIATLDSSGSITFDGAITGTLATAAQPNVNSLGTLSTLTVDDITINGSTISDAGDFILDIGGDITLDADGQQIYLKNNGTHWGTLLTNGTPQHFYIDATISDGDIIFRGNDGGSTINALTLDMSAAGQANFNSNIFTGNTGEFVDGSGTGDKGVQINPIGMVVATRNGGISGIFGRQASNGPIVQLRKNGVSLGEIGVNSSDLSIYNTISGHTGLRFGNGNIMPTDNSGGISDNTADLGESAYRFKNFYVAGSIYLGGTGTANAFDDYEEGTWTADVRNADNANTFSTEQGYYVKIGKLVHCSFLNDNGNTGGGGGIQIRNLPFTPGGSTNFNAAGIAAVNGGSLTNRQYSININNGNVTANIYNGGTGISGVTFTYISGQFTYYTNS